MMDNKKIYIIAGFLIFALSKIKGSSSGFKGVNDRVYDWESEAGRASRVTSVPANVILAVVSQESQGDPEATGSIGEIGLMQLTKNAVLDVGYSRIPRDPAENIMAGAKYLSLLINENSNLFDALRAYNYGRTRVRNGSSGGYDYAQSVLYKLNIIDGKRGIR